MRHFKPINQPRISDEIFKQLREAILSGDFKAGEKLPSGRELSEQFQVSRVSVREALRKLEAFGLLVTLQGTQGGAYVTDLTFEHLGNSFLNLFLADKISIPELHQVRIFFEPEVARLAALNVTPEFARRLRGALEDEFPFGANLSDSVAKGTKVHYILSEMCGNRFFEALVNSLLRLNTKIVEIVKPNPDSIHPPGMHRPIVEAVLAGNAVAAAAAMKKHAIEFGENLLNMERDYRRQISSRD